MFQVTNRMAMIQIVTAAIYIVSPVNVTLCCCKLSPDFFTLTLSVSTSLYPFVIVFVFSGKINAYSRMCVCVYVLFSPFFWQKDSTEFDSYVEHLTTTSCEQLRTHTPTARTSFHSIFILITFLKLNIEVWCVVKMHAVWCVARSQPCTEDNVP